jgi:streptogramin lyase
LEARNAISERTLPALLALVARSPATITEYQLPGTGAYPHDQAVGSDGIVWYADQNNSFIGRLDPSTGKITDVATPRSGW